MGNDYLVCSKCMLAFNMENIETFWVWDFIDRHWHKRGKKLKGYYFKCNYQQMPSNFRIFHNLPNEYIKIDDYNKYYLKSIKGKKEAKRHDV